MKPKSNSISGGCLCGEVEFTFTLPIKWCANCHCTRCQRSHGAGFVTWVGINENQFSLEKGKGVLTWASSSKKSKYGFCSKCGSSILFKSTKWDGEIHITLANLHFSFGIKPQDPTKITMHRLSVELPINFPKFGVSI
ncbi:MAG TPA: GFA family protein [Candidatus Marinimicrobia bacterium]|jgi:hypothetical protein|nr:GFA family protein [Candidatus Neomarinimicrobiota bacterium]